MPLVDTAETVFPAVPASVGAARRFTRASLIRHAISSEVVDTAMLLVSELTTNAVVHAASSIRLRIDVGSQIRVEVRDTAEAPPVVGAPEPEHESGRGMAIVTGLADSWDWAPRATGKVVWFELARD